MSGYDYDWFSFQYIFLKDAIALFIFVFGLIIQVDAIEFSERDANRFLFSLKFIEADAITIFKFQNYVGEIRLRFFFSLILCGRWDCYFFISHNFT